MGEARPATQRPTVGRALSGRNNALNFLRLVLAAAVILSHTAYVGGFDAEPFLADGRIGRWAVNGFFVISGYLVTGSRMRMGIGPFLWRRFLRIAPAYWVVLLVTAFSIAPASTLVSGEDYMPSSGVSYAVSNSLLLQQQLGIDATLLSVPNPGIWNVSLWTLFWEFLAYVLAGILLTGLARRHLTIPFFLAGGLLAALIYHVLSEGLQPFDPALPLSYFLAGMLLCFMREKLPVSRLLAFCSGVVVVLLMGYGLDTCLSQLPLGYLLLYIGSVSRIRLGARNDISYGVYIYAFPMQQVLVLLGGQALGPLGFAFAATLMTVPLALASWHLVEGPALTLRRLVPAQTHPGVADHRGTGTQLGPGSVAGVNLGSE